MASEVPNPEHGGGFWSRLWRPAAPPAASGTPAAAKPGAADLGAEAAAEATPTFDAPEGPASVDPLADTADEIPLAQPWPQMPAAPEATVRAAQAEPVTKCQVCGASREADAPHCGDCGWLYPTAAETPSAAGVFAVGELIAARYEALEALPSRPGVSRFRVRDRETGMEAVLLASPAARRPKADGDERQNALEEPLGRGGSTIVMKEERLPPLTPWPSVEWEAGLLTLAEDHGLPRYLDSVAAGGLECIVHEIPAGMPLWDSWDDPETPLATKFCWLADLARTLMAVHEAGAIVEALRPERIRLGLDGKPRFIDLGDFLPLPLPDHVELQASLYSAPELILQPMRVDARADLFGFGALLAALLLGRELTEMDFELHGVPKPFVERFPDAHPLLARLMMKTFVRELSFRFPTDEASLEDPTGFLELIDGLAELGRQLGRVRLDIASWTSAGLVRTSNEDACAVLHAASSRQDAFDDRALILLTDGMGGCEAGEVASALAIDTLRTELLRVAPFSALVPNLAAAEATPATKAATPEETLAMLKTAMAAANMAIYEASRSPEGKRRGMGCTAEAVFLDGAELYAAHVGDSRTYLFRQGALRQITRDQTLVARLVELGQLTEAEAQHHPRRNELQQALGGHSAVEPLLYRVPLQAGDVVLVCSDGLTGMLEDDAISQVLQRGQSAEAIARRLVNLANLHGGVDNTTVAVVRLT